MIQATETNVLRSAPNMADARLRVTSGDGLELLVVSYEGEEMLGRLFSFEIQVAVELELVDQIQETSFVGEQAALILMSSSACRRSVRGLISDCAFAGLGHKHAYYKITLSPTVWPLTQRVNCRVFQDQSTPQIIAKILSDHSFSVLDYHFALKETYKPRNYCVQYRESDWDFISRMMEEEGMYCFYREKDGRAVLHVTDGPHGHFDAEFGRAVRFHPPRVGPPGANSVVDFQARRQVRPGRVTQCDYAAVKPSMPLDTQAVAEAGAAEVFDYPGEYRDKELGNRLAAVRLEELRTGRDQCTGRSLRVDFAPGHRFQLGEHPIGRFNRGFLLTGVKHRCFTPMAAEAGCIGGGTGGDGREIRPSYVNEFTGMPEDQPFRPARTTPRPRVAGPQTAVVVGPRGKEIHTDRYGRVKVWFRWDRKEQLSQDAREESDSSCWIRVSQPWAGVGYGGLTIPRIGQEVIVDFLEGDPDQPIITGRVYNGESMQPTSMAEPTRMTGKGPEPVPAMQGRPQFLPDTATRTSIRGNSTPGGGGANEITLDDAAGGELVYVNATKDSVRTVGNDDTTTVGNNRKLSTNVDSSEFVGNNRDRHVGANEQVNVEANQDVTVKGNRSIMVQGCETHTVQLCRAKQVMISENVLTGVSKTVETGLAHIETIGLLQVLMVGLQRVGLIGRNDTLIVGNDKSDTIHGNLSTDVKGEAGMTVGSVFVMECPDITLKSGGNFIRINGDGVTIKGTKVKINCSDAKVGKLSSTNGAVPPGAGGGGAGGAGTTGGGAGGAGAGGGAGGLGGVLKDVLKEIGIDIPDLEGLLDMLDLPADSPLRKIFSEIGNVLSKIPGLDSKIGGLLQTILNNGVPSFEDIMGVLRDRLPPEAQKWYDTVFEALKQVNNPPMQLPAGTPAAFPGSPGGGAANASSNSGGSSSAGAASGTPPSDSAGTQYGPPTPPYIELRQFAESQGFTVTSTTGGDHNPGSAHYEGNAIDVRTNDKTDAQVTAFIAAAQARGYTVRDERTQPAGQAVWSGPHLHLQAP
jgi:type VI secretion system secreted protein VgrG